MPRSAWILPGLLLAGSMAAAAAPTKLYYDPTPIPEENVVTQHDDNQRTGRAQTTDLSPGIDWSRFGFLFDLDVDGDVYAQPLYVSGLYMGQIAGSFPSRNVVFIATMKNNVYAFDAYNSDNSAGHAVPLWKVNLGPPVPVQTELDDLHAGCHDFRADGFIGVLSTPVIDVAHGLLFVVAKTFQPGPPHQYAYTAFKLDLKTGRILAQSDFGATVSGEGLVGFDALHELNRPGLLLTRENKLLVAFGSHCDQHTYRGWVYQMDANLVREEVHTTAIQGGARGSGIWQAGNGLATAPAVPESSVFYSSSNGDPDPSSNPGINLSDSLVRLCIHSVAGSPCPPPAPGPLDDWRADDWFSPDNRDWLNDHDLDFGSSGPTIISGASTLYALTGGKEGSLYLRDAANLGHYGSLESTNFQKIQAVYHNGGSCGGVTCHIHGSPVWWKPDGGDAIDFFVWGESDHLRGYRLHDGAHHIDEDAFAVGKEADCDSCMPGGILTLSSNQQKSGSGIVWAVEPLADTHEHEAAGQLWAYNAADLTALWSSGYAAERIGKFVPPTVAHDRVFLATHQDQVRVFGLRTERVCEGYTCGMHNGELCGVCGAGQVCGGRACVPDPCAGRCGTIGGMFCGVCESDKVCNGDHRCVCRGATLARGFEGTTDRCAGDRRGPSDGPTDRGEGPPPVKVH